MMAFIFYENKKIIRILLFISIEESLQWLYFVKYKENILKIKIFISQENDLYGQTKAKEYKLFETKNIIQEMVFILSVTKYP